MRRGAPLAYPASKQRWLVAVPLGIVALLGLLLGVLPRLSQRPWTIIGLATLAVVAGLFRGDVDGWRRAVRWGVAMTLAVVLSLLAPRAVPFDLPRFLVDGSLINLRMLIVLLIIGLLVGIAVLLVLAVKTRQVRLGVYLLAVAVWVAALVILSRVVPGTTGLNIDLSMPSSPAAQYRLAGAGRDCSLPREVRSRTLFRD